MDMVLLTELGSSSPPKNANQSTFDIDWGITTESSLCKISNRHLAYFAPSCCQHQVSYLPFINTIAINGWTVYDALSSFWHSDNKVPRHLVEPVPCYCTAGLNCNPTCPSYCTPPTGTGYQGNCTASHSCPKRTEEEDRSSAALDAQGDFLRGTIYGMHSGGSIRSVTACTLISAIIAIFLLL